MSTSALGGGAIIVINIYLNNHSDKNFWGFLFIGKEQHKKFNWVGIPLQNKIRRNPSDFFPCYTNIIIIMMELKKIPMGVTTPPSVMFKPPEGVRGGVGSCCCGRVWTVVDRTPVIACNGISNESSEFFTLIPLISKSTDTESIVTSNKKHACHIFKFWRIWHSINVSQA